MLYEYKCPVCGRYEQRFVSVTERHGQVCECGSPLVKLVSTAVAHIWKPYYDDLMDDPAPYIESKKQWKQEMEERGLQPRN